MTVALISQGDLTGRIDLVGNPALALPRYDEACRAVAELKAIDEVDGIIARAPPGANQYKDRVATKPEAPPTLAEAGIGKSRVRLRIIT